METIIFDFDGTIADSLELGIKLYQRLGDAKQPLTPERIDHLRHLPALQVAKELKVSVFRIPKLMLLGRYMMAAHLDEVKVFDGIPEALKTLHEKGFQLLVVSSNSAENVRTFLNRYGLEQYFTQVFGGAGIFDKGRTLKRIIRKLHLKKEQCTYVGDEARDIDAARRAKVRIVSVGWGYNHPDLLKTLNPDTLVLKPVELPDQFTNP